MTLLDFSRAVRTRQWAKNLLLWGGLIFAGRLRDPVGQLVPEGARVMLGFACFCALSGAAYLINDWQDLERDRLHPTKKNRPLASGRMPLHLAFVLLGALLAFAAVSSVVIGAVLARTGAERPWSFALVSCIYFLLTLSYSLYLKHEVIIDVLCLALGFVTRVVAGCVALPVRISPWIIFCTFTLALFVSLCKRRAELLELGSGSSTRKVLQGYNLPMLDTFISVAACLTITSYSLYTFNAPHRGALSPALSQDQTPWLMTSIPFVVYGVFRYLFLAHSSTVGGEPEQMLRDKPLVINVALWVLVIVLLTLWG